MSLIRESSRGDTVLFAVVTALLSSHAMDLGQLLILGYDALIGKPSSDRFRVEGGLLVLATGFLVLVLLNARRAMQDNDPDVHASFATGIVVGLLGGGFSILEKTADPKGMPTPDTAQGMFILLVAAAIFVVPLLCLPWRRDRLARFMARLAFAVLVGALFGGLLQYTLDLYGTHIRPFPEVGKFTFGNTSFYMSAPPVAGLIAGWVLVAVDPLLRPQCWGDLSKTARVAWTPLYLVAGVGVSALYAFGPYTLRNMTGWMDHFGYESGDVAIMMMALHVPALLGCAVLLILCRPYPSRMPRRLLYACMVCAIFICAGTAALFVGASLARAGAMTSGMVPLFGFAHASVAVIALFVLRAAYQRSVMS